MREYREESNAARQFLEEHCHFDSSVKTLSEKVFGRYLDWSKRNWHVPIADAAFGKEVRRCYPQVTKKRATVGRLRPWAYAGLAVDDGDEPSSYNVIIEEPAA